jgi:hypothetical protein
VLGKYHSLAFLLKIAKGFMSFLKQNMYAVQDVSMFVSSCAGVPSLLFSPKKIQQGAQLPQFPYLG